jgi:predicted DNA-binding protein (UPF0251 family)
MSRKFKVLTAALVVAGLLVVAFGGFALADTPVTPNAECPAYGGQMGGGGQGHGMGAYFGQGVLVDEVATDLLGLSAEEIEAQRLEGKSLAEIAAAQGVSQDTLVAALVDAKTAKIQELVDNGVLTQERAEYMLENIEQQTTQSVTRTETGPSGAGGGYSQMGMYRWAQAE